MLNKNSFALLVGAVLIGAAPLTACVPVGTDSRPNVTVTRNAVPMRTVRAARRPSAHRPAPKTPDPDFLLGLDTSQVEQLLGAADLRRREPPAQVWQYAGGKCVLHLFMYESDGDFRVVHYEANDPLGQPEPGGVCLASLIDGQSH